MDKRESFHLDFNRTICHYSKLSLWSRRENERERKKWRRGEGAITGENIG